MSNFGKQKTKTMFLLFLFYSSYYDYSSYTYKQEPLIPAEKQDKFIESLLTKETTIPNFLKYFFLFSSEKNKFDFIIPTSTNTSLIDIFTLLVGKLYRIPPDQFVKFVDETAYYKLLSIKREHPEFYDKTRRILHTGLFDLMRKHKEIIDDVLKEGLLNNISMRYDQLAVLKYKYRLDNYDNQLFIKWINTLLLNTGKASGFKRNMENEGLMDAYYFMLRITNYLTDYSSANQISDVFNRLGNAAEHVVNIINKYIEALNDNLKEFASKEKLNPVYKLFSDFDSIRRHINSFIFNNKVSVQTVSSLLCAIDNSLSKESRSFIKSIAKTFIDIINGKVSVPELKLNMKKSDREYIEKEKQLIIERLEITDLPEFNIKWFKGKRFGCLAYYLLDELYQKRKNYIAALPKSYSQFSSFLNDFTETTNFFFANGYNFEKLIYENIDHPWRIWKPKDIYEIPLSSFLNNDIKGYHAFFSNIKGAFIDKGNLQLKTFNLINSNITTNSTLSEVFKAAIKIFGSFRDYYNSDSIIGNLTEHFRELGDREVHLRDIKILNKFIGYEKLNDIEYTLGRLIKIPGLTIDDLDKVPLKSIDTFARTLFESLNEIDKWLSSKKDKKVILKKIMQKWNAFISPSKKSQLLTEDKINPIFDWFIRRNNVKTVRSIKLKLNKAIIEIMNFKSVRKYLMKALDNYQVKMYTTFTKLYNIKTINFVTLIESITFADESLDERFHEKAISIFAGCKEVSYNKKNSKEDVKLSRFIKTDFDLSFYVRNVDNFIQSIKVSLKNATYDKCIILKKEIEENDIPSRISILKIYNFVNVVMECCFNDFLDKIIDIKRAEKALTNIANSINVGVYINVKDVITLLNDPYSINLQTERTRITPSYRERKNDNTYGFSLLWRLYNEDKYVTFIRNSERRNKYSYL